MIFPISELPDWLQKTANQLPITHGLTALRDILLHGTPLFAPLTLFFALSLWDHPLTCLFRFTLSTLLSEWDLS